MKSCTFKSYLSLDRSKTLNETWLITKQLPVRSTDPRVAVVPTHRFPSFHNGTGKTWPKEEEEKGKWKMKKWSHKVCKFNGIDQLWWWSMMIPCFSWRMEESFQNTGRPKKKRKRSSETTAPSPTRKTILHVFDSDWAIGFGYSLRFCVRSVSLVYLRVESRDKNKKSTVLCPIKHTNRGSSSSTLPACTNSSWLPSRYYSFILLIKIKINKSSPFILFKFFCNFQNKLK